MQRRHVVRGAFARAAVVSALVAALPVRPALAHATAPQAQVPSPAAATTSVLELDGADPQLAAAVSTALRDELLARGLGGGRATTTAEIRIALECEVLDEPCLARAARLLDSRRVVFGALRDSPLSLKLQVFVADEVRIAKSIELPLSKADLAEDRVSATMARAADLLFPDTAEAPLSPIEPAAFQADGPASTSEGDEARTGRLVWGPYSPRPPWKWAAFGTSAALFGAGLITTLAFTIPVAQSNRGRGFLHRDLVEEAEASLTDGSVLNDVDPHVVLEICSSAEGSGGALEVLDEDDGVAQAGVRNVLVGRECRRGEAWARGAAIATITTAVMAVSTIAFTTLLFVHRVPRERRVSLGIAPGPYGGVHVGGGVRF